MYKLLIIIPIILLTGCLTNDEINSFSDIIMYEKPLKETNSELRGIRNELQWQTMEMQTQNSILWREHKNNVMRDY